MLERDTGLNDTAESGVRLDAELTPDLLETLFTPHSPLHDGAVIIRNERVIAAGVTLPLSETGAYQGRMGTRHRAALGITEQTDAVVVVVSEETGGVSLVERGRIVRNLDESRLAARAARSARAHTMSCPNRGAPARASDSAAPDHPAGREARPLAHCAIGRAQPVDAERHGNKRAAASTAGTGGGRIEPVNDQRPGRVRRALDFLLRNWPLKLGAILLATVLYSGLVLAQNVRTWTGQVPVDGIRPPIGATLISELEPVTAIRYRRRSTWACSGRLVQRHGRPLARRGAVAGGPPVSVPIVLIALDQRIQIVDFQPREEQVQLDPSPSARCRSASSWEPCRTEVTTVPRRSTPRRSRCAAPARGSTASRASLHASRSTPARSTSTETSTSTAVDGNGNQVPNVEIDPPSVQSASQSLSRSRTGHCLSFPS